MNLMLPPRALREACHAWASGGSMGLGHWFSKYRPRFSVSEYSQLVALVREELQDDTDYSMESDYEPLH